MRAGEERLIERTMGGDREAFGLLVAPYRAELVRFAGPQLEDSWNLQEAMFERLPGDGGGGAPAEHARVALRDRGQRRGEHKARGVC